MPRDYKSEYAEKLKDPRWQKRRLQILERDKWSCQECGTDSKTLHVHHRFYDRGKEPWESPDHALVTLCEDCHEYETTERACAEHDLLRALRRSGFMQQDVHMLAMGIAHLEGKDIFEIASAIEWTLACPELRAKMVDDCMEMRTARKGK